MCAAMNNSPFSRATELLKQLADVGICDPLPGLSREEIAASSKNHSSPIPPPIAEWLTFCNGVCCHSVVANVYGLEGLGYGEYTAHWKERGWTAIADDGCGSYYLVVKMETREGTLYPVIFADHADSVIEDTGETQLCNRISYVVASDLPHFLEAVFLCELHDMKHRDRDDDEYLNFWYPFDKERVRQFDPNIEKIGIITPWDANVKSIREGINWLLQKGNRTEARQSLLYAVELAKESDYVSNEMIYNVEALVENGFIRDALEVIRNFPPSYARSQSLCYITFCQSEYFDYTPEEVAEIAVQIAESGFSMLLQPIPLDKCDRYFALYLDTIVQLINEFAKERGLKNAVIYLDRLKNLVYRLTDPMDCILSLHLLAWGYFRNENYDTAEKIIDKANFLVENADKNLWDEWEFYKDDPLTYENVRSWVQGVKDVIVKAKKHGKSDRE
jgi:hypothetical protein